MPFVQAPALCAPYRGCDAPGSTVVTTPTLTAWCKSPRTTEKISVVRGDLHHFMKAENLAFRAKNPTRRTASTLARRFSTPHVIVAAMPRLS